MEGWVGKEMKAKSVKQERVIIYKVKASEVEAYCEEGNTYGNIINKFAKYFFINSCLIFTMTCILLLG